MIIYGFFTEKMLWSISIFPIVLSRVGVYNFPMPRTEPFEKHSDEYDKWFETHDDLYALELEALRQSIPRNARGLEVGVGSGKFAAPLGIKTGVEPSPTMAAKAEKMGITVYRGVAEDLPFKDCSFDFVLMVTTICFVDDIEKSFQEAYRVVRPKGHIIIGFVDRESELGRRYQDRKEESKFYKEATFFSTEEVIYYLVQTGFIIEETKQAIMPQKPVETIQEGTGEGSFVVIKAKRK